MSTNDHQTSLDEFRSWKVENLRKFLTLRGLSKDGTKKELAALCFSALTLNLPVIPTQKEVLDENKGCYMNIIESLNIPDPLNIFDEWISEKEGLSLWPPIFLSDISSFFLKRGDVSAVEKTLKDYKVGKAYEYYVSGWLKEVFLHLLDGKDKCIVRAKCCPSQRLRDDYHDCWACVKREDGSVLAAYCTCTAGLGQTCNHVAALLFRVEAANRYGCTAVTSSKCSWDAPTEIKALQPKKISALTVKKSCRSKKEKSRPLVSLAKKNFEPLKDEDQETEATLSSLAIALRGVLPNACIFRGLPVAQDEEKAQTTSETDMTDLPVIDTDMTDLPVIDTDMTDLPVIDTTDLPLPAASFVIEDYYMQTLIEKFKCQTTCYDFLNFLLLRDVEVDLIEKCTIGQHNNENWHSIRKGRLTASKFYNIYTKVETVKKKADTDCCSLVKIVMGYTKVNPNIKSLKHGRETEPIAVEKFLTSYKKKHVNVQHRSCGIFLNMNYSILAASPDLLISCDCCGEGLLEVKCPMIPLCIKCPSFCTCVLPDYIVKENDTLIVKKKHSYYFQVQGQMALSNRKWCDLFIYTVNGFLLLRITLDLEMFENILLPNLKYFFVKYVLPELMSPKLNCTEQIDLTTCNNNTSNVQTRYFCPVCNNVVKESENVVSYRERSVACDKCNLWYHFPCVNFKTSQAKLKTWVCPKCVK